MFTILVAIATWTHLAFNVLVRADDVRAVNGLSLGSLSSNAHSVSGKLYVVDARRLRLVDFNYDGTAPDAFFWIGIKGNTTDEPSDQGTRVADENGSLEKLKGYTKSSIVLKLPDGVEATDIVWFSVWCRQYAVNFGHLVFPKMLDPPAPRNIGEFSRNGHQVRSGDTTILNAKQIQISDLHYDGRGPDAFFWVGTGDKPDENGKKIPDESGSSANILKGYSGQTIILTLPGDMTFYDIDWLSMWCIRYTENFGNVKIPSRLNVPPYIASMKGRNCEQMDENFNVAWEIDSSNLVVELSALIESDDYASFGLSGSDSGTSMDGADVVVTYFDDAPRAVDYKLTEKAQCSNGRGACPDDRLGGKQNVEVISGSRKDSITTVKYKRALISNDTADLTIQSNKDVYIAWAYGKLNKDKIVTKHVKRTPGNKKINFSRDPVDSCTPLKGKVSAVKPWPSLSMDGMKSTVFTARIGPAGGRRGYNAITNFVSWGIAWYINDTLIPELTLKRGVNYTFLIQGGDNINNTAEYHPFYITTDPNGGYVQLTEVERKKTRVFAGVGSDGNPTSNAVGQLCEWEADSSKNPDDYDTFKSYFSTLKKSSLCNTGRVGKLTWMPDANTPNTVYYQCYTHRYLGWKINIVDEYTSSAISQEQTRSLALFGTLLLLRTLFF